MVDNWDLLYMSIHSLNKMLEDHRHVLESWQIKVVIIDECHLLFGETFRHQHSWKALHRLVALKAKMVFMSGTMNQSMIKMLAHYTGMETNYTVIGNVTTYPPPNVSINIHRAQNPIKLDRRSPANFFAHYSWYKLYTSFTYRGSINPYVREFFYGIPV